MKHSLFASANSHQRKEQYFPSFDKASHFLRTTKGFADVRIIRIPPPRRLLQLPSSLRPLSIVNPDVSSYDGTTPDAATPIPLQLPQFPDGQREFEDQRVEGGEADDDLIVISDEESDDGYDGDSRLSLPTSRGGSSPNGLSRIVRGVDSGVFSLPSRQLRNGTDDENMPMLIEEAADVTEIDLTSQGDLLEEVPAAISGHPIYGMVSQRFPELHYLQVFTICCILSGQNVFLSGAAGTGKSVTIEKALVLLRERFQNGQVVHTGVSGVAAKNIDGVTLQSWSGSWFYKKVEEVRQNIQKLTYARRNIKSVSVLIVDEISMSLVELMKSLDTTFQEIRGNRAPFGGVQVVFVGDFFQLPPVEKGSKYLFEDELWDCLRLQPILLQKVFRQRDSKFVRVLNKIRIGTVDEEVREFLQERSRAFGAASTEQKRRSLVLVGRNDLRNEINERGLETTTNSVYELKSFDLQVAPRSPQHFTPCTWMKKSKTNIAATSLNLSVDAKVMCTKNLSPTIVNGSIGVVVGFVPWEESGMLLFPGKRVDGLNMRSARDAWASKQGQVVLVPKVRFVDVRGEVLMGPEAFSLGFGKHGGALYRIQVPLTLAFACTVHKAQGVTLGNVIVKGEEVPRFGNRSFFAPGHAYVALSRCQNREGLLLQDFREPDIHASQKVVVWMRGLEVAQARWLHQ